MRLVRPEIVGGDPGGEQMYLSPRDAAARFWASPYAAHVDQIDDLRMVVIAWLTGPLDLGGLSASWRNQSASLHRVITAIEAARP